MDKTLQRVWILFLLLSACSPQQIQPTPTILSVPIFIQLPTGTATVTSSPSATPEAQFTSTATPVLAPYEQYSIDYLRARPYGGGHIDGVAVLHTYPKFTQYSMRYESDGLFIYAVMNIPNAEDIYPVIISVHGYFHPEKYYVLDTDFTIENALAEQGYITIHPTMRNYPPSDSGDNLFRVGDTIDILNLIAAIRSRDPNGPLKKADTHWIGLLGHSMGGGIILRALTIDKDIQAAVLYAPTSGDEALNIDFFHNYTRDPQFKGEGNAPADAVAKMSPQNYYPDIATPILIAHGINDDIISDTWSEDTCNLLKEAHVDKTCFFYQGASHEFKGADLQDFISETIKFFNSHLN